jgi:hypothetical protein
MKCPIIKDECWGADCMRWDPKRQKCTEQVRAELESEALSAYGMVAQYYQILWRMNMNQILRDPDVPDDIKESLRKATDAQTVEELLRQAKLI